jgi:hypothetical protein
MMPINLIPAHRLDMRRTRRHVRLWLIVGAMYTALLIVIAATTAGPQLAGADIDAQIEQAKDRLVQNQQHESQLSSTLRGLQYELAAARYIAQRPDWSVLLAEVAAVRGDDVVLHTMSLTPDTSGAYVVRMAGHGRSQPSVSALTLRLEECGLFSHVKVLSARREPYLSGQAIRFELECVVGSEAPSP